MLVADIFHLQLFEYLSSVKTLLQHTWNCGGSNFGEWCMSAKKCRGEKYLAIGSIQTLFRGILKSLNILISTGPSDSSSKMSQKTENIRSRDCRNFRKFSIQSFETLTRFCGNTVCLIWNLTGPCERGRRDLYRLVLWRYTDMALIGVFMILLNRSNRRLSKIRNHTLFWKNSYIISTIPDTIFQKNMNENMLVI